MATPDPALAVSVAATLREASAALTTGGIEEAPRDARLLLGAALGVGQTELILRPDRLLDTGERARFQDLIARRLRHEPVSRILGEREFYGRNFLITPATLDPRPDTETVIDAVLDVVDAEGGRHRPLRILDIGTGTGCLILTLLAEIPGAVGVGIDVSHEAVSVAEANAALLGLHSRCSFRCQAAAQACDTFDIVVSNPPYIPKGDVAALGPEVRLYDPHLALDGGPDGLEIYRQIARRLEVLVPSGWAFFEVGAGQMKDVTNVLRDALGQRLTAQRVWKDLARHERCVAVKIQK
jgi:release factor glutamine methyltransferase